MRVMTMRIVLLLLAFGAGKAAPQPPATVFTATHTYDATTQTTTPATTQDVQFAEHYQAYHQCIDAITDSHTPMHGKQQEVEADCKEQIANYAQHIPQQLRDFIINNAKRELFLKYDIMADINAMLSDTMLAIADDITPAKGGGTHTLVAEVKTILPAVRSYRQCVHTSIFNATPIREIEQAMRENCAAGLGRIARHAVSNASTYSEQLARQLEVIVAKLRDAIGDDVSAESIEGGRQ